MQIACINKHITLVKLYIFKPILAYFFYFYKTTNKTTFKFKKISL